MRIMVDADACPVKGEVYRVAKRYDLDVIVVANSWMRIPAEGKVALEVVKEGFDGADDWIVDRAGGDDIVVTADIPLASRCLEKGASVIGPKGRPFTESNIGEVLATRNLLRDLRDSGEVKGGPPPFSRKDRSRFLEKLDQMIHAVRRQRPQRSEAEARDW